MHAESRNEKNMKKEFTILGKPIGKGRPRFSKQGGIVRTYTPENTAAYEELVKLEYERQCGSEPFPGGIPLFMKIKAYFPVPASASKKKRLEMLENAVRPTKKPDMDNIVKIIADSLNGIAYHDDSQIVDCEISKYYGDIPRVEVAVISKENEDE